MYLQSGWWVGAPQWRVVLKSTTMVSGALSVTTSGASKMHELSATSLDFLDMWDSHFKTRIPYSGKLWGRKLSRIEKYDFHGENFCRLLPFAAPMDALSPNFVEKTFANIATKPRNSWKLSPLKVSRSSLLLWSAVYCSLLMCSAVYCSVLMCSAVYCRVL